MYQAVHPSMRAAAWEIGNVNMYKVDGVVQAM